MYTKVPNCSSFCRAHLSNLEVFRRQYNLLLFRVDLESLKACHQALASGSWRLTSCGRRWWLNSSAHLYSFSSRAARAPGKWVHSFSILNRFSIWRSCIGVSLAIWDHTELPGTRHKWTHPALTLKPSHFPLRSEFPTPMPVRFLYITINLVLKQESWAIAKMTVRCALCMGALKI